MSEDERAARDRFFAVVDELRLNLPDVSQAEVEADVAVAIVTVRAGRDVSFSGIGDFGNHFPDSLAEAGHSDHIDDGVMDISSMG